VARRSYGHGHAHLERRPSAPAVVEHELEHAVAVGNVERGSVEAGFTGDGAERGADVQVEHREIELEVMQPRVGHPSTLGIVPGDVALEHLWTTTDQWCVYWEGKTHDGFVDGVMLAWRGFVHEVMRCSVDTEPKALPERPGCYITRELHVSRLNTAANEKSALAEVHQQNNIRFMANYRNGSCLLALVMYCDAISLITRSCNIDNILTICCEHQ
jgi:hypothetical protein